MELLELTLESPAENVALDEALLDEAEAGESGETLRLWKPAAEFVVIGRSSRATDEVRLDYCREQNIPVLRRASGGAAIVTGPGCLMYAVVLSLQQRPQLRSLDATHQFVLGTIAAGLAPFAPTVARRGTSDLTISPATGPAKKFSGNSVRLKRRHVLYHGTLLYDFPLDQVGNCLAVAPRQPEYRTGRDHNEFIANLPITAQVLRQALVLAWQATAVRTCWPQSRVAELLATKYQTPEWTIQV